MHIHTIYTLSYIYGKYDQHTIYFRVIISVIFVTQPCLFIYEKLTMVYNIWLDKSSEELLMSLPSLVHHVALFISIYDPDIFADDLRGHARGNMLKGNSPHTLVFGVRVRSGWGLSTEDWPSG
jgi:hypothetical protein